jgi:hypothetical protein
MEDSELRAAISAAQMDLSDAEGELDKVMGEIRVALRAEKTLMTSVVEDAFSKLRRARTRLDDLQARLSEGED